MDKKEMLKYLENALRELNKIPEFPEIDLNGSDCMLYSAYEIIEEAIVKLRVSILIEQDEATK